MKAVKNKAELTRKALAKGATVTLRNGSKINAARERRVVTAPPAKPKVEAAPEAPRADSSLEAMKCLIEKQEELIAALREGLSTKNFSLKINRDEQGFMTTIDVVPNG